MTSLSDTQAIILSAAAQRAYRVALPLPQSLRGGTATKVVGAMLAKGFLEEVDADPRRGEPIWRETGDGHGATLIATDAGLAAIGIEPDDANTAATAPDEAQADPPATDTPSRPVPAPTVHAPREGTKQAALIALLQRPEGASIAEAAAALEWQPHTLRGAISGALKKRLGLAVSAEKIDGRGTVYRIAAEGSTTTASLKASRTSVSSGMPQEVRKSAV